tara:strand:+ start:1864 stop:2163 length:300 start_codon:yes stop_codon:yes gene_type:complete
MLSITKPISTNITPKRLPSKSTRIRRVVPLRAIPEISTPDYVHNIKDFSDYAGMQVVAWMLPMTIAGRVLGMEYKDIGQGLLIITLLKTVLKETNIIHF